MTAAKPEPMPMDFVYGGQREGVKTPLVDEVHPIGPDGKLAPPMYFKAARHRRVLGGIYTGALFSLEEGSRQAAGLSTATYTGRQWGKEHPEQVMQWEALDTATRLKAKSESLEKDAKKCTLIDETLGPLRDLYAGMRNRGDYEGMHALEAAILQSLRKAKL